VWDDADFLQRVSLTMMDYRRVTNVKLDTPADTVISKFACLSESLA